MLSGCGGLRGSGVLGGVIGACWGIPSTLRPSILILGMGSPCCIQIEINIINQTKITTKNTQTNQPTRGGKKQNQTAKQNTSLLFSIEGWSVTPIYSPDMRSRVYYPKANHPGVW